MTDPINVYCPMCGVPPYVECKWRTSLTGGRFHVERNKMAKETTLPNTHTHVYDSDVAPMQFGENLSPDVERFNSLFCACGHVNHYGTQLPVSLYDGWQEIQPDWIRLEKVASLALHITEPNTSEYDAIRASRITLSMRDKLIAQEAEIMRLRWEANAI